MVNGGIEGHKDIVRDVAWHPKRNEILTSSVSFINTRITQCSDLKPFCFSVGLQRQHQHFPGQVDGEEEIARKFRPARLSGRQ